MLAKLLVFLPLILLISCFGGKKSPDYPSYRSYQGEYLDDKTRIGQASWYGDKEHGGKTASGEKFNRYSYTAAHKTLPFGTMVRVTNLDNGKDVVVKINDRGPFVKNRIIDLSYAAGKSIGLLKNGTAKVKVEVLSSPSSRKQSIFNPIYTVQVGSFSSKINAQSMQNDLDSLVGEDVRVEPIKIRGNTFYRVRVGMFTERSDAEYLSRTLKSHGYRGSIYLE
ncbi:MAG: septal ring lytic transglycosylase RlpA family protein [Candidatus Dadabacteria bacterium]|nr:septal ring lytic transglycosylase RlpA family protein [Candidatus Dadabacteria bacterium]NIQ13054.1 septal ring lytic transglycosylase RlpA family protein [Candidatus Dadabacteria bacterium]